VGKISFFSLLPLLAWQAGRPGKERERERRKEHESHLITQNSLHLYNLLEGTLPRNALNLRFFQTFFHGIFDGR
jgi:hypothetical protein